MGRRVILDPKEPKESQTERSRNIRKLKYLPIGLVLSVPGSTVCQEPKSGLKPDEFLLRPETVTFQHDLPKNAGVVKQGHGTKENYLAIKRKGFKLISAEASSVHNSQGSTVNPLICDARRPKGLSNDNWYAMLLVMLTRGRSSEGTALLSAITGEMLQKLKLNPDVTAFVQILNGIAKVTTGVYDDFFSAPRPRFSNSLLLASPQPVTGPNQQDSNPQDMDTSSPPETSRTDTAEADNDGAERRHSPTRKRPRDKTGGDVRPSDDDEEMSDELMQQVVPG